MVLWTDILKGMYSSRCTNCVSLTQTLLVKVFLKEQRAFKDAEIDIDQGA